MSLVNGYDNYVIFENGDLINVNTGNNIIPTLDKETGYLRYVMKKDGVLKRVRQHKLLGEYFIKKPNICKELVIVHIEGERNNNKLSNLRWIDHTGNRLNSVKSTLNTSGWVGIKKKQNNKYLAKLSLQKERIEKTFIHLDDAQRWRNDIINSYLSQFT